MLFRPSPKGCPLGPRIKDVPDTSHLLIHCNHLESVNILKYRKPADDKFQVHCDAWNAPSSLQQISLVAYLNTVSVGGETLFVRPEHKEFNRLPQEGSVLLFPSSWQYPHKAQRPLSDDKYVLVAWFRFDPQFNKVFYYTEPL